jgi:glutaconyl-CoA/methylmalonyl-CoA decarboxylase subunit gamma
MKKLRITVSGKVYDVSVEVLDEGSPSVRGPARPATPAVASASPVAASAPAPKPGASVAGAVTSPLAGKVVSIEVKAGDSVVDGATLLVLEAMKMNTHIPANRAGTVAEVLVKVGDAVEEGQALVSLS